MKVLKYPLATMSEFHEVSNFLSPYSYNEEQSSLQRYMKDGIAFIFLFTCTLLNFAVDEGQVAGC